MRSSPSRWALAWLLILVETLCAASLVVVSHSLFGVPGRFGLPFGMATLWLTAAFAVLLWAVAGRRLLGPLTDASVLWWHVALILLPVMAFAGGLLSEQAAELTGLMSFTTHSGRSRTAGVGLLLAANVALYVPWLAALRVLANALGLHRLSYALNWMFVIGWAGLIRPAGPQRAAADGLDAERGRKRAAAVLFVLAILLALLVAYVRAIVDGR